MPYRLGKQRFEPVKNKPDTYRAIVEVVEVDDKGKEGAKKSISVEQNFAQPGALDELKDKIRFATAAASVEMKVKDVLSNAIDQLKVEHPDEYK